MRSSKLRFETRKARVRSKISKVSNRIRLSIFKSGKHIYAQVIDDKQSITIASASTLDKEIRQLKKSSCNVGTATKVGELIGERASLKGVQEVVFDKGGYKYHGVVKALADAARKKINF
ncbi:MULTISPECIES: 50S ribosomal protein L18 [Rickettsieae]|uniref:50S ribosomal protein L18 n=1 Tax=Rickettsieae TaxID=33988 RepID=UPI000B9ABD0E|nr:MULTISPECIES: 50S ribosomal protein L18 [unclassified Rickettsia]MDN3030670.1 50S ribosomal protein L18 [Candidatus Tisiphia sp.]OZG32252.1 50S ribosomal protein L18 [Rickettsia endosymbiont of Culicoides newsteadi]HJD57158.1 50S ribosomal protein L18 [Rickettsia endosymbiont of Sericostoma sp. HW-2014]